MFGSFGRRAAETVVVAFAVLGFCFVPLGKRTAFEHTIALVRSPSAHTAASGLVSTLDRARHLLLDAILPGAKPATQGADDGELTDPLPLPSGSPSAGTSVRPVTPRLAPAARNRPQR